MRWITSHLTLVEPGAGPWEGHFFSGRQLALTAFQTLGEVRWNKSLRPFSFAHFPHTESGESGVIARGVCYFLWATGKEETGKVFHLVWFTVSSKLGKCLCESWPCFLDLLRITGTTAAASSLKWSQQRKQPEKFFGNQRAHSVCKYPVFADLEEMDPAPGLKGNYKWAVWQTKEGTSVESLARNGGGRFSGAKQGLSLTGYGFQVSFS